MREKLVQLLERWAEWILGSLLSLGWKYVEKYVQKQVQQQQPKKKKGAPVTDAPDLGQFNPSNKIQASIHIPGLTKTIPLDAFVHLSAVVPHLISGLKDGKKPQAIYEEIKKNVLPETLEVAETILNVFFPGAGTVLGLIVWCSHNSKPLTQAEENKWFDRFGIGTQS